MAKIRNLKNSDGEVFYPLTHAAAVVDDKGVTIEDRMTSVESEMAETKEVVNSIKPIVINGDVANAPDEEDLTMVSTGMARSATTSVLRLKDRPAIDGMGYVILRKDKTFAEQVEGKPNTIFEIRYDFDLNGEEITIPEGCTLDFQGGSLSNGILIGNNTSIQSPPIKIFDVNIELRGSWSISEIHPEWFGGGISSEDNSLSIQLCLNYFNKVNLLKGVYKTKYPIYVKGGDSIMGKGRDSVIKKTSSNTGSLDSSFANKEINSIITIGENSGASNIEIRDVSFYAQYYNVDYGIYINNINNSRLFNIIVFQCKHGIYCKKLSE